MIITSNLNEALALPLSDVDRSMLSQVGGKAANLGDMIQSKKTPLPVPPGFVLTSESYRLFLRAALKDSKGQLQKAFDELDTLANESEADDNKFLLDNVRRIGGNIRTIMEKQTIPSNILDVITAQWAKLEQNHFKGRSEGGTDTKLAVAVRSSATAEDLPSSSFAGQQDTYLNIVGLDSVVRHIRLCWSSLFTDRAIVYRIKNKFDHLKVLLCVVVQKQIDPIKSGIMFTADAISGKRSSIVIEAGYGLGEALVSGLINADQYKFDLKQDMLSEKIIGDQHLEIVPTFDTGDDGVGGTKTINISDERGKNQKLNETEIHSLIRVGLDVQEHYNGVPQDIEWCFERNTNKLYVVQARPITTLFPLPEYNKSTNEGTDDGLHVFASFGHVQVMTDPIRPCGRSVFKHILSLGAGDTPVLTNAGAFMFIDLTKPCRIPRLRRILVNGMKNGSESLALSLEDVVQRDEFTCTTSSFCGSFAFVTAFLGRAIPIFSRVFWNLFFEWRLENTSARATDITNNHVQSFRRKLSQTPSVRSRLVLAKEEMRNLFNVIFKIFPYAATGMVAFGILSKILPEDENVDEDIDAARKGLDGNVTTEMDLVIGDLADAARQDSEVSMWLQKGDDLTLDGLSKFVGTKFHAQFGAFMDQYGCRGNSEIDISRLRWKEDPTSVLNVIRGNITNAEMGHHRTHHKTLQAKGIEAASKLLEAAPWYKKPLVSRLLRVGRTLGALREHHKFLMIQILWEVKQVVLEAASVLLARGALESTDDIWFLDFDEIIESFERSNEQVRSLVHERREEFEVQSKFKPPNVLTSDGECVNVQPNSGYVPPGALGGLAVSSGVVEGIAKVVTDPTCATLHSGEILVAPFTDPGWTPLFINAAGLVMEVGGFLTHGSVVSREYGIPAVSCIEDATTKIKTGMRLRVDGTRGFVEILPEKDEESASDEP